MKIDATKACNRTRIVPHFFEDFILEENLDGGWRKDVRNKHFGVTGNLVLFSLVGLLIPVFSGSVVYEAKVIAESTTQRIVSAGGQ